MIFKYQEYLITSGCWLGVRVILILDTSAIKNQNLKMNKDICGKASSTAGRKSKVKSQKSKLIYSRLFGDWIWLLYLRRDVLVVLIMQIVCMAILIYIMSCKSSYRWLTAILKTPIWVIMYLTDYPKR